MTRRKSTHATENQDEKITTLEDSIGTSNSDPKSEDLVKETDSNLVSPPASKESIEAAIHDKLSRKTSSEESNPFVPSAQLDNEVKQVAKDKGFPLSRGTEIGARLLARSQRKPF